jgi:hypothetical protein
MAVIVLTLISDAWYRLPQACNTENARNKNLARIRALSQWNSLGTGDRPASLQRDLG